MEQGICPKCKSENLLYGGMELEGEQIYYPFECGDCHIKGKEWYGLEYDETILSE